MKKRILLTCLMIVALVCLLTVTAFAEDIINAKTESAEYGTVIQLKSNPGLDNAKQYVSTLKKINDSGKDTDALCIVTDGTYFYVFPSSYIVWEISNGKFEIYAGTDSAPGLAQAMAEFNSANKTEYYESYTITGTWGGRYLNELVCFEFTTDVTWIDRDHCCMRSYPSLEEVRIGHAISVARARGLFQNSKKLNKVVGFEKVTGLESDTSYFFGCNAMGSVSLPTDITKIPSSMFWGCYKLVIENLSELTQLTTIGSSAFQDTEALNFVLPDSVTTIESSAFQSAFKKGGSFTINKTSKLTTIGTSAFNDCRTMSKTLYIPSTVTSIGQNAFLKCYTLETLENFENCKITTIENGTFSYVTNLKSIKIPETVTTIGTAFADNSYLTLVYIPKTVTSIADTFTGGKPTKAIFIYTGSDASVFSDCSKIAGATVIKAEDYVETNSYSGINLVVGYSHCKVYGHNYNGTGDCKDGLICSLCSDALPGAAEHTIYETVVYVSFDSVGVRNYGCSNEGCTKYDIENEEVAPIFIAKGYSIGPDGLSLKVGFTVNIDALNTYKTLNPSFNFGIVMANADTVALDDDFFVDNKLNTSAKGIMVSVDGLKYATLNIDALGFSADIADSLALVVGIYTVDTNGAMNVIQYSNPDKYTITKTYNGMTLNAITFNQVRVGHGYEALVPQPVVTPTKDEQ